MAQRWRLANPSWTSRYDPPHCSCYQEWNHTCMLLATNGIHVYSIVLHSWTYSLKSLFGPKFQRAQKVRIKASSAMTHQSRVTTLMQVQAPKAGWTCLFNCAKVWQLHAVCRQCHACSISMTCCPGTDCFRALDWTSEHNANPYASHLPLYWCFFFGKHWCTHIKRTSAILLQLRCCYLAGRRTLLSAATISFWKCFRDRDVSLNDGT